MSRVICILLSTRKSNKILREDKSVFEEYSSPRRSFLQDAMCLGVAVGVSLLPSRPAGAISEISSDIDAIQNINPTKPFAPIEALLPAARVELTIDRCVMLANEIRMHPEDDQQNQN